MGSLMSGWDSPTKDSEHARLMRNKSVTNDGIDEYWKQRKAEEEHFQGLSPVTSEVSFITQELGNKECRRAGSLPIIDANGDHFKPPKEYDIDVKDNLMKKNGWWTRSNWAFLNEPPVIQTEVSIYKYASQHHVSSLASKTISAN